MHDIDIGFTSVSLSVKLRFVTKGLHIASTFFQYGYEHYSNVFFSAQAELQHSDSNPREGCVSIEPTTLPSPKGLAQNF